MNIKTFKLFFKNYFFKKESKIIKKEKIKLTIVSLKTEEQVYDKYYYQYPHAQT